MTSTNQGESIFESVFCIIKEDRVSDLENFMHQVNDVNFKINDHPPGEDFCTNCPPIISVACYYGSMQCFTYLINHDADLNIPDNIGRLPVHYAAAGGHIEICDELDNFGVDFQATDNSNNNSLHYSCEYGHVDLVRRFFLRGFDLDLPNINAVCPIHFACFSGNPELLSFICEQKVEINSPTSTGDTPLKIIIKNGDEEMLKTLLMFDVDTNVKDTRDKMTPLMTSIKEGKIFVAEALINYQNTDVAAEDEMGWTALHYAAESGFTDLCMKLIKRGIDVNHPTASQMTALHLAQNRQRHETAKYLQSIGGLTWI